VNDVISTYLGSVQKELATGHAQEHSYRPALKTLFEGLTKLAVVNEPKGSAYGRPDLIMVRGDVPVAWVEAKDLHVHLDKVEKSEQMERYFGYANLVLTNGLEFRLFKNGRRYGEPAVLAAKEGDRITPNPESHGPFARQLASFLEEPADTIRSAQHLAQIMGGKAARLRDNIADMLRASAADPTRSTEVEKIRDVLRGKLIHDLTDEDFADLYAQTLVYGLFVARYHDDSPEDFSRTEARERIPASNHLLLQFFDHIAGANFERRLSFIVDELCDVFLHADVKALVHGLFQKKGDTHDPIIHFYEDFLREYDPKLRAARGVFYTPLPVVRFIVRSVDAVLREHFGLADGLADRSTAEWERVIQGKKSRQTIDRVQILDPAVGTGTFLNEVIRLMHERFKGQEGSWPGYVNDHLLGRLNGFELMMASYTIAHLKLGMTLAETGVKKVRRRLRVFLTNSLEEAPKADDSLFKFLGFQEAITEEAEAAAEVKRDLPIMVVLGNPPYSVSSQNASTEIGLDGKKRKTWIGALLDDYKAGLNERKLNLDDDYIKFIRFAHHLIEKNGHGVVAMITNNSFLDGLTHRRMRESLLQTFDHIYVVDLHGNSNRKEKAPDGGKDENVFDIQQGVCISLFVRTGKKGKKMGSVHHAELHGSRESKYEWLDAHELSNTKWHEIDPASPRFFFVQKDFGEGNEYQLSPPLNSLFLHYNSGIQTKRDAFSIRHTKNEIETVHSEVVEGDEGMIRAKYELPEDGRDWRLPWAIADVRDNKPAIVKILYRPFDSRWTLYTGNSKGFLAYPRSQTMRHMLAGNNLALIATRQTQDAFGVFVTDTICDQKSCAAYDINSAIPLYLNSESASLDVKARTANLNMDLLSPALGKLKLGWVAEGTGDGKKICGPEDIFDYVYAVLHSPIYRSRYKEFLKIDFPRVPFTSNAALFWRLVSLGRELRGLHLLESPTLAKLRTSYPIVGTNVVEKVSFDGSETGKVYINATQYFGSVPRVAWEFFIGGYQPAQKWLKDRKGRTLTSDDILHYQKMIVALCETDRLMKEIDVVIDQADGWPLK
jgi:predicted helicase